MFKFTIFAISLIFIINTVIFILSLIKVNKNNFLKNYFVTAYFICALWLLSNLIILFLHWVFCINIAYGILSLLYSTLLIISFKIIRQEKPLNKVLMWAIITAGLFIFVLSLLPNFFFNFSIVSGEFMTNYSKRFLIYIVFNFLQIAIVLVNLLYSMFKLKNLKKVQSISISIGIFLFISISSLTSFLFPYLKIKSVFGREQYYFFDTLSSLFFTIVSFYAILKYRQILDFDLGMRQFITHLLAFILLFIPFSAILFLLQDNIKMNLILSGIFIFFYSYLENILKKIFSSTFLGEKYSYIEETNQFPKKHFSNTFLITEELIANLLTDIKTTMRLNNVSFFKYDKENAQYKLLEFLPKVESNTIITIADDSLLVKSIKTKKDIITSYECSEELNIILEALNAVIVYPFFMQNELYGLLLLGTKKNQSMFNKYDLANLKNLGMVIAHKLMLTVTHDKQYEVINITKKMINYTSLEELAEYTVRSLMRILDVSSSSMFFYDKKEMNYKCLYNHNLTDPALPSSICISKESYLVRLLEQNQEPLYYDDIIASKHNVVFRDIKTVVEKFKLLRSKIIIPIINNGLSGFITLGHKNNKQAIQITEKLNCGIIYTSLSMAVNTISSYNESFRDELTSLYNRKYFYKSSNEIITECIRTKRNMGVLFIDADHFKRYNDNYSHDYGDRILKALAKCFLKESRKINTVCRFGGEEFITLSKIKTEKELKNYAERLRQAIKKDKFLSNAEVSVSIGTVLFIADTELDINKLIYDTTIIRQILLHKGDAGLYLAKSEGRDRVCSGGTLYLSELLGQHGYTLKVYIHCGTENEKYKKIFIANNCSVVEDITNNPDIILIHTDAEDKKWTNNLQEIVAQNKIASIGVITNKLDKEKKEILKKLNITKIFVDDLQVQDITNWIDNVKSMIIS
ncbi:MAG: GGDEF domain-containing protein [bacterium]|nr:GGDEF domain-containing protein [bacterium]